MLSFSFFSFPRSESSFETPSSFQRVNIDGTRVLLGAAHQARHHPQRFVYVSTDEVYGAGLDEVGEQWLGWLLGGRVAFWSHLVTCMLGASSLQVFDESSPVRPSNPYSATKAAAEYLVRSYWDKYKVRTQAGK